MKKIVPILLICLMTFAVGCAYSTRGEFVMKEEEKNMVNRSVVSNQSNVEQNISKDEIEMTTVTKNVYSASLGKLEVIITNNTSVESYADRYYSIEYYDGNVWVKVPLDFGVKDIQVILSPEATEIFSIYLHPEQHDYKPGKYRICKTVTNKEGKIYNLTAEFTITK